MPRSSTPARLALAVGVLFGGVGIAVGGTAPAYAAAGRCVKGTGVTVVVDYGSLGGTTKIACDASGAGLAASRVFPATGFALTRVAQFPGAVCRVSGLPGASQDSCVRMPPANAYWGLFWSDGSPATWVYSTVGVDGLKVPKGGSLAWRWQNSSTRQLPRTLPNALPVAAAAPAPTPAPTPAPAPTPSPTGSAGPTNPTRPTSGPGSPSGSAHPPASPTSSASPSRGGGAVPEGTPTPTATQPPPSGRSAGGSASGAGSASATPGHRGGSGGHQKHNASPQQGSSQRPTSGGASSDRPRTTADPVTEVTRPVSADSADGSLTWVAAALGLGLLGATGGLAWHRRRGAAGR